MSHEATLSDIERLRWEEWKYRHDLFHRLMFRYTGVVAAICLVPIFQIKNICEYNLPISSFGIAALILGVVGVLHIVLEFIRVLELRRSLSVFDGETIADLKENFPKYYFLRTRIPVEPVMWAAVSLFNMGLPLFLIFGLSITCPSAC